MSEQLRVGLGLPAIFVRSAKSAEVLLIYILNQSFDCFLALAETGRVDPLFTGAVALDHIFMVLFIWVMIRLSTNTVHLVLLVSF